VIAYKLQQTYLIGRGICIRYIVWNFGEILLKPTVTYLHLHANDTILGHFSFMHTETQLCKLSHI